MNLRENPVVLFDGDCRLCQSAVDFVLRHERNDRLRFCPLESASARALLGLKNTDPVPTHSVLFVDDMGVSDRSDAALRLAAQLRAPWSWARFFRWVPRVIRDRVYDWIAERRQRWFGRSTQEFRARLARHADRFIGESKTS